MAQQTYLKFPSPSSGQNGLEVWPCALENLVKPLEQANIGGKLPKLH
jgi:hypothetical protein